MTDKEYRSKMDTLMQTLATAELMSRTVSDEDLDLLVETIRRADGLSMFLVPPMSLGTVDQNLKDQEEAVRVIRVIRGFGEKIRSRFKPKGV